MDPLKAPGVTQQTVDKAQADKIEASLKAVGIVTGVTLVNRKLNAPGGPLIQKPLQIGLTGIHVEKQPKAPAKVSIPRGSIFAAFLPAPIGYVPAEFYGLHPEFVKRSFGTPIGSKPLGFDATPERIAVYEARLKADAIGLRAIKMDEYRTYDPNTPLYTIPKGPIDVTLAELAFLQKLPPGVSRAQHLIPELSRRFADLKRVPGDTGGPPAPLLDEFSPPSSPALPPQGPQRATTQEPVNQNTTPPQASPTAVDILAAAFASSSPARVALPPDDPTPEVPPNRSQRPRDPTSTLQQEAFSRAPDPLKHMPSERHDP